MAALLIPAPTHSHPRPQAARRPHLAVVPVGGYTPAGARRRAMAPVYRRRRIGVMLVLATLVVLGDHAASAVVRAVSPPAAVSATVASADVATAAESTPGVVAATPAMAPVTTRLVVVQPGDTLWSIARSLQPAGDVRQLVDELAQRAGGSGVQAGQRIDVSGLGSLDGDRAPSTAR